MVSTIRRFTLSYLAPSSHVIPVLFSILITLLREKRAGLFASHAFVCLSFIHYFLSLSLALSVRG